MAIRWSTRSSLLQQEAGKKHLSLIWPITHKSVQQLPQALEKKENMVDHFSLSIKDLLE